MSRLLFDNEEIIHTLGLYQPFGSLMLHGKIETRWVRVGHKPPFPLGRYLLYTTQKECSNPTLFEWCGAEIMSNIIDTLKDDVTKDLKGYALCYGDLYKIQPMTESDEAECFVKYKPFDIREDKNGKKHHYKQQCLFFTNIQPVEPFKFKGKQGVGILKQ